MQIDNKIKIRKTGKLKTAHLTATLIIIFSLLWILSGKLKDKEIPDFNAAKPQTVFKVVTESSQAIEKYRELFFYGKAFAAQKVELKSEIDGKIAKIIKEDGNYLAAGEEIIALDNRQYETSFRQFKANLAEKKLTLRSTKNLARKKLASKAQLAVAQADFEKAQADLKLAEIDLKNTKIIAPFAGKIEKIYIEEGEVIKKFDTPLVQFLNDNKILIESYIPEKLIFAIDAIENVTVNFSDEIIKKAELNYIANLADPETKTYKIELAVDNIDGLIKDGMTAKVTFLTNPEVAHRIKASTLTIDEAGNIGVKHITAENLVIFSEVKIIAEEGEEIYVSGLPNSAEIITVGHSFVKIGDQVQIKQDKVSDEPN